MGHVKRVMVADVQVGFASGAIRYQWLASATITSARKMHGVPPCSLILRTPRSACLDSQLLHGSHATVGPRYRPSQCIPSDIQHPHTWHRISPGCWQGARNLVASNRSAQHETRGMICDVQNIIPALGLILSCIVCMSHHTCQTHKAAPKQNSIKKFEDACSVL